MITLDDFIKVEIKIGTVLEAAKIPEGDRLLKLIFDFGPLSVIANEVKQSSSQEIAAGSSNPRNDNIEIIYSPVPEAEKYPGREIRQVMSAIAQAFPDPSVLVGKQIAVITNLQPRKFKGYESQGMIMAAGTPEEGIVFLSPEKPIEPGAKVK